MGAKARAAQNSSKVKKNKRLNKRSTDKVTNRDCLFSKEKYDELLYDWAEKFISTSRLVDHFKINGSLARAAITTLLDKNLIKPIITHSCQSVYVRTTLAEK